MKFDQVSNLTTNYLKRNRAEIMTGAGIGGTIISSWFFIKGTVSAVRKIDKRKKELGVDKLPVKELITLCGPDYIVPTVTLAASIGVIAASDTIKAKETGSLVSAVMVSRSLLNDYKDAAKEAISEKKQEEIEEKAAEKTAERILSEPNVNPYPTGNGDTLFIESLNGTVFRSSEKAVHDAFAAAERHIRDHGSISVNDLRYELDLQGVACGELLGFNESTENGHIDFKMQPYEYFGELCWLIHVKTEPIDHYSEIWPYR